MSNLSFRRKKKWKVECMGIFVKLNPLHTNRMQRGRPDFA